jgi:thiol-disulfide isomerase/thioredoxin
MLITQSPEEIQTRIKNGETFVLNLVSSWCPDCTERQQPNFPSFIKTIEKAGIVVYQCVVQEKRLVFLTDAHEALTDALGGHGYPRTTLILKGEAVLSRVEVMDALALGMLADEFVGLLPAFQT